ncbi:MAG: hypothetical protein K2Y13_01440 [Burkholderiaceae bacterium]|nr:hypothetical protein [Burkholderiaceae bacterium]
MLVDYLNHAGAIHHASISETFDTVSLKLAREALSGDFTLKLFDELKTISARDTFELVIEAHGNYETVRDCTYASLTRIKAHIEEFKEEGLSEIKLQIAKGNVNSTLSIYFLDHLCNYLSHECLLNLINTLANQFEHTLTFEVFSTIEPFGTETIRFIQAGAAMPSMVEPNESLRQQKLDLFLENATVAQIKVKLLPSDLYLTKGSANQALNQFFETACSVLALAFIANTSSLSRDNVLTYKISGYKTIICNGISPADLRKNYLHLHKIYLWTYEGGNHSDKLGLVRNVLSIHSDDAGNIKIDKQVWEALQSNYQIYLKGNIQSYLEVKNKIAEFIIELTTRTYSMADELLDSFKNNAFILLTFLISVVVVNGLKDTGETIVFSNAYLMIVIILAIFSGAWLLMTRSEVMNQFDGASKAIADILKLNYSKVLMESEINECVNPVIATNRSYLQNQVKRYTGWWILMLVIFLGSFFIGNQLFSKNEIKTESAKSESAKSMTDKPPSAASVHDKAITGKAEGQLKDKAVKDTENRKN